MRGINVFTVFLATLCVDICRAQTVPEAPPIVATPADSARSDDGLKDLDALTLSCPRLP
jgi:hypothetical protein